jgi:thiol-disulfide isomerase/thioredoxin
MNKLQHWIGMVVLACSCCLPLIAATQQKVVVAEDFTATWCQYCPGAARGLDQLDDEQDSRLVVIAYHASGDPFYLIDYSTRGSYYGVSGIPTVVIDGSQQVVGGSYGGNMYSQYLPIFNARKAVTNPIDIFLSNEANDVVKARIVNTSGQTVSGKLHFALIQRHIAYPWQSMTELDYVNRGMLPSAAGVDISLTAGQSYETTRAFTLQPSWNRDKCRMVVFVQGSNREIYQGAEISLPLVVPYLQLTSPNGGEMWAAGSRHPITWDGGYFSGDVKIEYSPDGGSSWEVIDAGAENDGEYPWRLPEEISSNCRVRISDSSGALIDVSDAAFSILGPGDINGDGFTDLEDVVLLADHLAEILTEPLEADLNGDGVTNSVDLMILYFEMAG